MPKDQNPPNWTVPFAVYLLFLPAPREAFPSLERHLLQDAITLVASWDTWVALALPLLLEFPEPRASLDCPENELQ